MFYFLSLFLEIDALLALQELDIIDMSAVVGFCFSLVAVILVDRP